MFVKITRILSYEESILKNKGREYMKNNKNGCFLETIAQNS